MRPLEKVVRVVSRPLEVVALVLILQLAWPQDVPDVLHDEVDGHCKEINTSLWTGGKAPLILVTSHTELF